MRKRSATGSLNVKCIRCFSGRCISILVGMPLPSEDREVGNAEECRWTPVSRRTALDLCVRLCEELHTEMEMGKPDGCNLKVPYLIS